MNVPNRDEFQGLLKAQRISKRLLRDLRYNPEEIAHVKERDFLVVTTKSGTEGVLLYENILYPFELHRRGPNKAGRVEAVICDLCATWQRGTASAIITLRLSDKKSISHLVCGDLECSLHVRDVTSASRVSRMQLREHITPEGRVARLHERIRAILA